MGERGNIAVADHRGAAAVYLYTHWRGYEVEDILADALARRERWDDAPYLTRIIFDKMTNGDRGTTGFGISVDEGDNSYPIPYVNVREQSIHIDGEVYSFTEFIKRKGK